MKQEFELIKTNVARLLLVWVVGLVVVLTVAVKGLDLLEATSKNGRMVWFFVVVGGGFYLLYRIGKAVSGVPLVVVVAPDRLTIMPQTSEETQVLFSEIMAYRASSFNGAEELRLTLKDASKLKINVSSRLYDNKDFDGMVQAFETAVGMHQTQLGQPAAVVRERTFFEKPISTIVLVLFTAGMVWAVWMIATSPRPVRGSTFSALGSYLVYVGAWWAARERRNEKQGA
ncbi:hypothetical protein GCM10027594_25610 [Hymenobacter agri]